MELEIRRQSCYKSNLAEIAYLCLRN